MEIDVKSNRQCIYCHNFCKFSCPSFIATNDHKILETNKNYLLYLHKKGDVNLDAEAAKSFYLCNDCKRCEVFCWDSNKDVLNNNRAAREVIYKNKLAPVEVYEIENNFKKYGNFFSAENTDDKKDKTKKYDMYVYAGEYARYYEPKLLDYFTRILDCLGITYIFDPNEISSGVLALDLGMEELSVELMKKNFKKINSYNFDQMIVLGPEDYYAFKFEYDQAGLKFKNKIVHYSEFLAENISKIKLNRNTGKFMYFDPCKLGRYCGIYDEPREVLKELFDSRCIEFFRNKEEAYCCGGVISLFDNDIPKYISRSVIEECKENECNYLITACPLCLKNLKDANQNSDLKILDIAEVVYMNLMDK